MGLPHFPDRNTDIDPDTLPQVSQMWPIIPPTQSLKKGMNLAVEEAVMVASAIGDASPLLGGKGGEGQYLKGGEGRRKEERQCSCLELGKKAQSTTLCDIGHCAMCLVWIKIEWAGINSAVTLSLGGLHRQSTNAHYITFCDNTDGL